MMYILFGGIILSLVLQALVSCSSKTSREDYTELDPHVEEAVQEKTKDDLLVE